MHHLLLTSPEMCLDHPPFMKLMCSAEFTKNLAAVITDEAHCISQWGNSFRKRFSDLRKLQSFVPVSVPFLATSATLTSVMLAELKETLHFDTNDTFLLNLGNDRPNVTLIACLMRGAASDLSVLDFVANEAFSGDSLKRTIIFFNTCDLIYKGQRHLRQLLKNSPQPELENQIGFIHAGRTMRARRKVMQDFRKGKIKILCATEAVGMV
jgi:superfamily II DNA helicase RecQ